jgi:glycosyltransferase involved in cell wall biosynthesis
MDNTPTERNHVEASTTGKRIAILIPCLNEEQTIGKVVRAFAAQLRDAHIIVCDNNSSDGTAAAARAAGAKVITERRPGKGVVVQSMFQWVDADILVLVDGDDTYPAERVDELIRPILRGEADMVVGSRLGPTSSSEFKQLNLLGNRVYQVLINRIFRTRLTDILSGYRAMTARFVRGVPLFLSGFEVETELTIKSLQRGYRIVEIPINLRSRPVGSESKIRILRDGWRILLTILALWRDYRPLTFFGLIGLLFLCTGVFVGLVPILEYMRTGLVGRFPLAILAVGLVLSGLLMALVGLILHTTNRRFHELEYYARSLVETGLSAARLR